MKMLFFGLVYLLLVGGCSRKDLSSTTAGRNAASAVPETSIPVGQTKLGDSQDVGVPKSKVPAENGFEKTDSWKTIDLKGKRLELVDPSRIEILDFVDEEYVVATLGIKEDAVAGPILMWDIKDGALVITAEARPAQKIVLRDPYLEGKEKGVFGRILRAHDASGNVIRYRLSSIPSS